MTEKDLEPLYAAINVKSDKMRELTGLMIEENRGLKRAEVILELDGQFQRVSKEWNEAFDIYRKAAIQYWEHDRLIELGSSWRNIKNREEAAPNSGNPDND